MSLTPRGKTIRPQNTQSDTTNNPRVEGFLAAQAAGAAGTFTGTSSSVSLAATAAPRILAITPDSGFNSTDLVTNVSRVTLRGSGTAGSRVYVQVDGVQVAVVSVASTGTWQWTPSVGLAEGVHRVTAYSLASDGTRLNSNVANVTIDQTAPDLTLNDLAAAQDSGTSASDFITQNRNLTLTGTGEAGSRLSVLLNGTVIGGTTIGSNGAWSYNLPRDLTDGTYQVTLRESDRAGNVTTHTQEIVVDNQAVLTLNNLAAGSDTGSNAGDFITQSRNLTLTGAAEAGAQLTLSFNGGTAVAVTIGSNGTWTYDLSRDLTDGTYQVTLQETDRAGNVTTRMQEIVIDNQAPQVSGAPGGIVAASSAVSAGITGQLIVSEAANFAISGNPQNGSVTISADGAYTYTPNAGFAGNDRFTIQAADDAGNVSTQTIDVTVRNDNGEFRVNTYTLDGQQNPSVTMLADGGFVVIWQSTFQDGSSIGIYGQRYGADGTAAGSEFRVNSFTNSAQLTPSVTGLADGGFVVTWESFGQQDRYGIYGQRYGAGGTAVGPEFQINTYTPDDQISSSVTALSDGGFVVTWVSFNQDGSHYGIYGQRYDAGGVAAGAEFRINTYTSGEQSYPSITALEGGGFVVSWQSDGQDGSGYGIYGQRYGTNGDALGAEFRVNTFTSGNQQRPSLTALTDGGFVVTWESFGQDGSSWGVYGQRYGADGTALGSEFQVNSFTNNIQFDSSVTALADGGFVVTWESFGQDGSNFGIYAQRYSANGAAAGSAFRVNSFTNDHQQNPSVTALADGGFVVTWESNGQDGSNFGIFAQRYDANGNSFGTVLTGGAGNQLLLGGDRADLIDGGAGADTIDGGASTDRIIYGADALQTAGAVDTIRNFDASGSITSGDRIDLSDLLTSLGFANNATARALGTAFQIVDQGGGNYDLRIDADRSGGGTFEVTLAHIQVTAGTLDAADFILV